MSHINPSRVSKSQRREEAREKARIEREKQLKEERKRKRLIQGGVVVAAVAALAVVGLIVAQAIKPAGPGPRNMASGGVVFAGPDFEVQETVALEEGESLIAQPVDREKTPIDVVVYADYMCPHCGLFEQQAGSMLEQWVGSGQATLQIYPLNFQDNFSRGTRYSTRAANALACIVEQQPKAAWEFHQTLLAPEVQPQQNTVGLTDDELLDIAERAGASVTADLRACVTKVQFGDYFTNTTRQALSGPLVGLAEGAQMGDGSGGLIAEGQPQHITGTPTVLVNGVQAPTTVTELEQFMLKTFAELETGESPDAGDEEEADE